MANKKSNAKPKKDSAKDKKNTPQEKENKNIEENGENLNDKNVDVLMAQAAEQLEAAKSEAKEWKDNYTRVYAEWDTYRRRSEEQRVADKATATESLVTEILPILDDFERSIDYAKKNGEAGLVDGVEAIHTKLVEACCKSGMEVINPEYGEPFDALQHQAVQTIEDSDVFDESIHSVLQKGFKLGVKVLRPATVVLTTGGEIRPKDEEDEEKDVDDSVDEFEDDSNESNDEE